MDWKTNQWLRAVRRAAVVFIGAAIANITITQNIDVNTVAASAIAAGLLGLEKYIREQKPEKKRVNGLGNLL